MRARAQSRGLIWGTSYPLSPKLELGGNLNCPQKVLIWGMGTKLEIRRLAADVAFVALLPLIPSTVMGRDLRA